MLRKSLFLSLCFCLMLVPMALAGGRPQTASSAGEYVLSGNGQTGGLCYRDVNGQGDIIDWVKSEQQCVSSTNGLSWGTNGVYKNIQRR